MVAAKLMKTRRFVSDLARSRPVAASAGMCGGTNDWEFGQKTGAIHKSIADLLCL
jgi:hypothetical protein